MLREHYTWGTPAMTPFGRLQQVVSIPVALALSPLILAPPFTATESLPDRAATADNPTAARAPSAPTCPATPTSPPTFTPTRPQTPTPTPTKPAVASLGVDRTSVVD